MRRFSDDAVMGFLCIVIGIWIGTILTLCVHHDAINEHKFREYKQQNTNSVVEFDEWNRLRNGL
jgi:hypothetical protein